MVGKDPESGEEITAQNGRYVPYLNKGTDSRSLETEEQLFTVTLEEALKLYAQPKQRGRAAAKPPLRELGTDPASGNQMVVKDGRFGPYVTDGAGVNASLRKGDDVEALTDERASELLAEKRAKDGTKPTKAGSATAKKSTAKSPASKSSGTKSAATKSSGTKAAAKTGTKTVTKKAPAKKTGVGTKRGTPTT